MLRRERGPRRGCARGGRRGLPQGRALDRRSTNLRRGLLPCRSGVGCRAGSGSISWGVPRYGDASGSGDGLFGFDGAGALAAALVDGGDGVTVCVAGLDLCVVEAGRDDGLGGGDALPGAYAFAAVDGVSG